MATEGQKNLSFFTPRLNALFARTVSGGHIDLMLEVLMLPHEVINSTPGDANNLLDDFERRLSLEEAALNADSRT